MLKDKKVIHKIISKMLENMDIYRAYNLNEVYDELEDYVNKIRMETLGWAHADACVHIDKNIDYRTIDCPSIAKRAIKDLCPKE